MVCIGGFLRSDLFRWRCDPLINHKACPLCEGRVEAGWDWAHLAMGCSHEVVVSAQENYLEPALEHLLRQERVDLFFQCWPDTPEVLKISLISIWQMVGFLGYLPLLQFSFSILISFYSLHSLFIVLGVLLVSSPLTFFLLLDLTLFFYNHSNTSDDVTTNVMFNNVLWSSFPYLVFFLSWYVGPCIPLPL